MGPKYVGAFVVALGLNLACSRIPKPARTEKSPPEISRLLTPKYSTAGIAPSGATATAPLAPGRLVSIYGANLGPTQPCHASPDPNRHETPNPCRPNQTLIERQVFPGRLCDTEVQVGGVAAGLLYVSAGQINFKVPQSTATQGETTVRVLYKGQPGPSVSIPLAENAPAGTAEDIAASMWSGLQRVKWLREYTVGSDTNQCDTVPAHPSLRDGLYGHAYYCAQPNDTILNETFFYPVDYADPKLLLMRADIRPVSTYPELSAEVEQWLIRRLTKAYGAGVKPENLSELGASRPDSGYSWSTGRLKIFLHRNRSYVAPAGVREGVVISAVREEILEQRRLRNQVDQAARSITQSAMTSVSPRSEPERIEAEKRSRVALIRLLRQPAGDREHQAADLVAADKLAVRLGGLLVARSLTNGSERLSEAAGTDKVRIQLASYGVRFGDIGHYSGDLMYDNSLLNRAWKEYPETRGGQRAFLMLQRLNCSTPLFGCDGPNCFLSVIQQGERFLEQYPDTAFRREQIYHLALANETWWSLAQAAPGDVSAEGARVTKASAERARLKAVELYEELIRVAPGTFEAQAGELSLPRLKLKLDTGARTFFCFSC